LGASTLIREKSKFSFAKANVFLTVLETTAAIADPKDMFDDGHKP